MFDVITIGGATQDIFFISKNYSVFQDRLILNWGEKFLADNLFWDVGGGACNSAVALSRLGFATAFFGKVGLDIPGQVIAQRLKQEKVSLKFLVVDEQAQTSTSAVLAGNGGERSIVMYRGHNDNLLSQTQHFSSLSETSWIYLSDLGSSTEPLVSKIVDLIDKNNINLAFIPGQHQLKTGLKSLSPILKLSKILILNAFEASTLLGSTGQNPRDIKEMLREFSVLGAKIVVITRDKQGVDCFDEVNFYHQDAPLVKEVVDTTGAGDAFSSAFLAGIINKKDINTSLLWGNKNAGSVISFYGAQHGLLGSL